MISDVSVTPQTISHVRQAMKADLRRPNGPLEHLRLETGELRRSRAACRAGQGWAGLSHGTTWKGASAPATLISTAVSILADASADADASCCRWRSSCIVADGPKFIP